MDKNTIYGLLLMALVFIGFMWLQPKKENEEQPDSRQEQKASTPDETGYDALSENEMQWLINNIAANGVASTSEDGKHLISYSDNGVQLTLAGDSVYGTISANGKEYTLSQLTSSDHAGLSIPEQRNLIGKLRDLSASMGKYGKFSKFLAGDNKVVELSNDVLKLKIDSKSGSIKMAELKDYDSEYSADESKKVKNKVVIFNDSTNRFNFTLPLAQPIETADLYFTPHLLNDSTLLMALDFDPDTYWGIEYTLPRGKSYVIGMRIVQKNMSRVVETNNKVLGFDWTQQIKRQEQGRMFEERNSGVFYKFAGGSVENLNENKNDSEERQVKVKWIAFKNQFFSSVIISRKNFNNADFESNVIKNSDYLKDVSAHATVNDYDWSAESPAAFDLYIGPNLYPLLSHLEDEICPDEDLSLTRLIPLGWTLFRWINVGIVIPVFSFLGKYIHSYGIIILLLTIFIKLILFPLTYKSYKSQAKMRILAPDIQKINEKYPGNDNAMLRQQKTMELYSKAGASPMSGCLPMLLQMPILFAMFTFFPSAIELRGQSFLWAHDLSAPDAIISWSGNIPLVTAYFGNHISLFCLLMTATNIIYTHINMQNTPSQMPGMKWMMYLMPVFFLVFFNNYAAGLSYYYFLSLLMTIMQTYAFRYFIKEDSVRKAMAEAAKKPKKKSGFMARLEEMQKEQQRLMKEQQKKGRR